jgi:hypothetical protein
MSVRKQKFIDVKNRLTKNTIKPRGHTMILSDLGRAAQILCQLTFPSQDRWVPDCVFRTKKCIYRCMVCCRDTDCRVPLPQTYGRLSHSHLIHRDALYNCISLRICKQRAYSPDSIFLHIPHGTYWPTRPV